MNSLQIPELFNHYREHKKAHGLSPTLTNLRVAIFSRVAEAELANLPDETLLVLHRSYLMDPRGLGWPQFLESVLPKRGLTRAAETLIRSNILAAHGVGVEF